MKKIYVVLIVLITLALARLVFVSNNQNITGNSGNTTTPGTPGSTFNCQAEISNLFKTNDKKISSLQVQSKQKVFNGQKYNTSIFNCPNSDNYAFGQVFLLTKVSNDGSKETVLFSMADSKFIDSKILDINADKIPELVVTHSNGGNCKNCTGESVFRIDNDAVKDLFPDLEKPEGSTYSNVWLTDINNDGIEDVLVTDDSWELHDGFFHANSPSHIQIITWKDGKYQPVGEMFSKYYLNQISERNKELNKLLKSKETGLNDIVSLAIENYWDYQEIGKNDEGYANFILQTSLETLPKTIAIGDSDKIWLLGIRNEIEKEYKEARPTIMPLY